MSVFDTETTGLGDGARIVEVAALPLYCGLHFETLVDPGAPIPVDATKIHGIDDAMVQGAPNTAAALRAFLDYARGAAWRTGNAELVAFHAEFDLRVLRSEAQRVGIALPGSIPVHCARVWAKQALPGLASYALKPVAAHLGARGYGPAHRAHHDAELTRQVAVRLLRLLARPLPPAVGTL